MLSGKNCAKVACALLAVVALMAVASPAVATIIVTNGSFEDPTGPISLDSSNGEYGFTGKLISQVPTGWTGISGVNGNGNGYAAPIIHVPFGASPLYPTPADGAQLFGIENDWWNNANAASGIYQDLGTMAANQTYTFSAVLSSNNAAVPSLYRISLYDVTTSTELGAITQANFDPSASGALQSVNATFSVNSVAGDTLRLILLPTGDAGNASRVGVDAVSVTTSTIPEPGTLVLLATGLFGLLCYAWRKRK